MEIHPIISYRINRAEEIVFVSDSWNRFALENDAPELVGANVVGQSLWSFISDKTTIKLYRDMLAQVRSGKSLQFNLNCDSSDKTRFTQMNISLAKDGEIQFQARILQIRARVPQENIDAESERSDDFIHMCSWCKSIDTGERNWEVIDDAVSALNLFEQSELPQITHGMCEVCYRDMSETIPKKESF